MRVDDLFEEIAGKEPWDVPATTIRMDVVAALRTAPRPKDDDLETAISLTRVVYDELMAYGTDGNVRLTDEQLETCQRALRATLARHDIDLDLPWRDFNGFRGYWLSHDGYGSWQARRDILKGLFEPVFADLYRQEDLRLAAVVADPVTPHSKTGWPAVDDALDEVKRRFRSAQTPADYSDVGNRCVAVIEALSRTVYNPAKHLRLGETEPSPDKTDQRIGRFIEDSLGGADHEDVRGVAKKVAGLAHKVKHRNTTATRRDAGIAADSVILLANILRRVDQEF